MKIKSSIEWNNVELTLDSKCRNLTYCDEVRKMIKNITMEVTELSKAEVYARRGKRRPAIELLNKINKDIEMIEEYLLVAALMG